MKNKDKLFAVLGLSRFGYEAAISLYQKGYRVIAIDKDDKIVQKISSQVDKAIQADLLDQDVLDYSGASSADTVIIGLRKSFDATILLIHHIKSFTKIQNIIVLAESEEKAEIVQNMGVTRVIFPERDSALLLTKQIAFPNLVEEISITPDATLIEINCPESFVGKSLKELQIRSEFKVHIIGIIKYTAARKRSEVLIAPHPDTIFEINDRIMCLGSHQNLVYFTDSISSPDQN